MSRTRTALAAALALASLAAPLAARASNEPIPGIDIIVRKEPGGTATRVATTGRDGQFSGRVTLERGQYVVITTCRAGVRCPAVQLGALTVNGQPVRGPKGASPQRIRGGFLLPLAVSGPTVLGGRVTAVGATGSAARYTNGGVTHEDTWDQQR
jgi:hypothetical protein